MLCLKNLIVFILIFANCLISAVFGFNVNFRHFYDVKVEPFNTQIYKREMLQFFDKASFSFNGFEKIESVPVIFPIDICLMNLEGVKYAASLHKNMNGVRELVVFKANNVSYEQFATVPTPTAISLDCISIGSKGYVAIAINATTPIVNAKDGSPIFEIAADRLRAVQYFSALNLYSIYLLATGNDVYLLQTFRNTKDAPNLKCPYYIWSGTTFNKMGDIPCSNARHLEPFTINYESYVAVANYADNRGRTSTYSEIYKFNREKQKFLIYQKIKTNGAVDVKYFNVPFNEVKKQHFLIFGNSISTETLSEREKRDGKNLQADSVFYVFDKEQFMPYQSLSLYAVEQFLPVKNIDAEKFILLVDCADQDIKIYNFNDWKFEESSTQFTQGALSRGVAKMRIFQQNDNSYLIIANELMAANETNIFLPIFKQDEHANALRQQIIDWAKDNTERLAKINVGKLKESVQAKLARLQDVELDMNVKEIREAKISSVITNSLVYPRLHIGSNYWKALTYANQALDALKSEFNTRRLKKREISDRASSQNSDYQFDHLNVGTLVVRDKFKTQRVNGVNAESPTFKRVDAKKVIVTGNYQEPTAKGRANSTFEENADTTDVINVENLQINGKLNEYTWNNLLNNTLKRKGIQFLKAPAIIGTLRADNVVTTNKKLSGENLNKLVTISGGSFVINQDIQFAAPIKARNVTIYQRLNNIPVHQNRLNVLLKRDSQTQVVEGPKRCESIKVVQPVTIAGRLLGAHFDSLSPNKAIHGTVTLNGDYTINGNVTIARLLKADNLIDVKSKIAVKETFRNAIELNKVLENVNLIFEQPIEANNSVVSFVNAQDLQQLIKTNFDDVQVIEGKKIFSKNLEVRVGFSEVKTLNGVDVEKLEKRLFLKNKNQTIKVPMHFGNVLAKGFTALDIKLSDKNLSDYLTKNGDQFVKAALKVENLTVHKLLQLNNLNTNAKIFNKDLTEIYQQKTRNAPNAAVFHNDTKFEGAIFVKNLIINTTINEKSVADLERQLTLLDGNIKYVGNYIFNYKMNIENLTFNGKLNGIPAADFGRCWLQKTGDQLFTAPQTFATVNADKGLELMGKLNSIAFEDFFEKTYWIDRDERIKEAVFENAIQLQGALTTPTVNGIRIPDDMLYRYSKTPQIVDSPFIVQETLTVDANILNTHVINNFNLQDLDNFLSGSNYDTLHVENANFSFSPYFETLNQHDLKRTLDAVWLTNDNVNLQQHVEIAEAYFDGLVNIKGSINNMNLAFLAQNYFSLSKSQEINARFNFLEDVITENDVNVRELRLFGPIIESKSASQFNFNEFVSNTLKTAGPHKISGKWRFDNATVIGDLEAVQINNLNLAVDVVRNDAPLNQITANKYIKSAVTMQKLYATPQSSINSVDLNYWLRNTVFVYENYTIMGNTTLDTVNINNNLEVQGTVDNIVFNAQNLLLRDRVQTLKHDLKIQNRFDNEQTILSSNFKNLQTNTINGWSLPLFYENAAKLSKAVDLDSHLIFKQPVHVKEYKDSAVTLNFKWKRGVLQQRSEGELEKWLAMENTLNKMQESLRAPHYILDHFEIRQSLNINATHLIPLTLRIDDEFLNVVGVYNETLDDHLQYYRWNAIEEQFYADEALSWLPQHKSLIDLLKLCFETADYISIVKPQNDIISHNIISHETAELEELLQLKNATATRTLVGFQMQNSDCFVLLSINNDTVPIYCFEIQEQQQKLHIYEKCKIPRSNVIQILALSDTLIALLFPDAVEIWQTNNSLVMVQHVALMQPKQIAVGHHKDVIYLAVLAELHPKTLLHGNIEIYSSQKFKSDFQHLQSLDCIAPKQVAFTMIPEADDLLLHVVTESVEQPLNIYQFKGVLGFEKIIGPSTLPRAKRLQIVHIKGRHMVALFGETGITFMEILLRPI